MFSKIFKVKSQKMKGSQKITIGWQQRVGGGRESWGHLVMLSTCLVERPRRTFSDCRPVPGSLHPCAPAGDEHTHEQSHLHTSRYHPEAQKAKTFRIAELQAQKDSGQKARNSFRDISKMQNHIQSVFLTGTPLKK